MDQRPADNEARAGAGEVAHGDIETRLRAGRYEHAGQPDRAGTLRREAAILRAALGER